MNRGWLHTAAVCLGTPHGEPNLALPGTMGPWTGGRTTAGSWWEGRDQVPPLVEAGSSCSPLLLFPTPQHRRNGTQRHARAGPRAEAQRAPGLGAALDQSQLPARTDFARPEAELRRWAGQLVCRRKGGSFRLPTTRGRRAPALLRLSLFPPASLKLSTASLAPLQHAEPHLSGQ